MKIITLFLLCLFPILVHAQNPISYTILVDKPAQESYSIVSNTSEVASIKRDVDITVDGKAIEAGYHIQITPHLSNKPVLKVYIKSIIADPTSTDSKMPGYSSRTQSLIIPLTSGPQRPAMPNAPQGTSTLFATVTAFEMSQPVTFKIWVTFNQ